MGLEQLPKEVAEAINKGVEENQLIKMAGYLLENGDQENAARVLEYCMQNTP